jgi:proteasome accessory factor B
VRFRYFKPGEPEPRRRTVDPLAVVLHDGRWHLHAYDHDAAASRTFLLSRIIGEVTPVPGSSFDAPPLGVQDRIIAELQELHQRNVADLAVTGGSDAEVRLGKRAIEGDEDAGVIRLHYTDAAVFADELAAYGPEVRVLSPASLRDAVRDRLRAVAAAHRDATDAADGGER